MKRIAWLFSLLAACAALSACAADPAPGQDGGSSAPPPSVSAPQEADKEPEPSPEARAAFAEVLEGALRDRALPDGARLEDAEPDRLAENQFAVFDVDGDGEEELVLLYTTASMAGMLGCVFGWDAEAGEVRTELREFPALTFYDNGAVKAEWSHNQGFAGDFWPYNLYRHEPDTDSYTLVGSVDAWDRSLSEIDFQGNPFPEALDESGTGVLYYLMAGDRIDYASPVDAAAYEAWAEQHLGGASEVRIPYQDLTEEHIAQVRKG